MRDAMLFRMQRQVDQGSQDVSAKLELAVAHRSAYRQYVRPAGLPAQRLRAESFQSGSMIATALSTSP